MQQHVLPLFDAPYGHLRAKAAWLAGVYADADAELEAGPGPTWTALLQRVVGALNDPDLPVRVDAAVAGKRKERTCDHGASTVNQHDSHGALCLRRAAWTSMVLSTAALC